MRRKTKILIELEIDEDLDKKKIMEFSEEIIKIAKKLDIHGLLSAYRVIRGEDALKLKYSKPKVGK